MARQSRPDRSRKAARPNASGSAPHRHTRQRDAVRSLLEGLDDFRSARDIYAQLQERGDRIGLVTVYRILQVFAETGDADVVRSESGEALYRKCGGTHHHHLMCRLCGHVVEVGGPAIEAWADSIAAEHGFVDVSHSVEIFGRCDQCTANAPNLITDL